ncbi:MAG: MFS transporter [Alphaproteobacteria bacterium]|nr:MFS transporter [Alphaproteobacteria bacterium]
MSATPPGDNSPSGPPTGAGGTAPDRRSYAALRYPAARIYLLFAAMAMMADHVEHAISYWIIFAKFNSPALSGFAVISHWLPFLLGSIWAGALADRFDPRRIIQIGMALFMAVSIGWGILFATDSLQQWHAVILLIVHGCAGALWAPAGQVLIHKIVGTPQLQSGIRLMATSITLGMLLGPAVGGALMLNLGPAVGIIINAAIYLPLLLWLIRYPAPTGVADTRPAGSRITSYRDMIGAMREISGVPVVLAMTLLAGISAAFIGNGYHPNLPEFARDFGYGVDGFRYTLLLTAYAAGAVTAGLTLEARNLLPTRPRTAFVLAIFWCMAIGGFAISGSYNLAIVLLVCAGFFELSFVSMARTLAQLHAPAHMRGRAIGLFNVGALGFRTFSGVTIGFGGGIIGIHWSLGLSAAALLVVLLALFVWLYRAARPATVA